MEMTKDVIRRYYGWSENPSIEECAEKAYNGDASRPITGIGKMSKECKDVYKGDIFDWISLRIKTQFPALNNDDYEDNNKAFDKWHHETCQGIISKSDVVLEYINPATLKKWGGRFSYGIAQKWLNMTMKNMLIAELEEAKLKHFERQLHVPIDSMIMRCATEFMIDIPKTVWSQWNDKIYTDFQIALRKAVVEKGYKSPIDWEFGAWATERDKL